MASPGVEILCSGGCVHLLWRLRTSLHQEATRSLRIWSPPVLLMAANADFAAGAWCSATELYELGLVAQS